MKNAIEKAIEGGWNKEKFSAEHINLRVVNTETGSIDMPLDCVFLDPEFWRCLGKAMGWTIYAVCMICDKTDCDHTFGYKAKWVKEWHRFIDHLAEGRDTDSFFKELLK